MYAQVFKANPFHGKDGRFTSKDKAVSGVDDLVSMGDSWMGGSGVPEKLYRIPKPQVSKKTPMEVVLGV